MYEPPIKLIMGEMQTQFEENCMRAVQSYGFDVDKNELVKTLEYDRNQYEKGYADGRHDAVAHGHKIIQNRPYAAQYIYVGDDGYGNLVKRTDYSGTAIEISPAILSNPVEYCSECGKRMDGIWQNFCDNCGAKMDEVSE